MSLWVAQIFFLKCQHWDFCPFLLFLSHNLVLVLTKPCCRWMGILQMMTWENWWTIPLNNLKCRGLPPPGSQSRNSLVTAVMTSWWIRPPWRAAITFAATVWRCGGNLPTRMSAPSAARNGKAFLKSTYCWGMFFTSWMRHKVMFDVMTAWDLT